MDPFLEQNLITTKDAAEISGYSPDYLGRLVRSKKIIGRRIGHSWLIERESLVRFVAEQKDLKIDRARALARAREKEYRVHRSPVRRVAKLFTKPLPMPEIVIPDTSLRAEAVALAVAFVVVGGAVFTAEAAPLPQLGAQVATLAGQTALGFSAAFGDVPARIAENISNASASAALVQARVAEETEATTRAFAPTRLAALPLARVQMPVTSSSPRFAVGSPAHVSVSVSPYDAGAALVALAGFVTSPARIAADSANAYHAVGEAGYALMRSTQNAYLGLIARAADRALAFAAVSRDALATSPRAVASMDIALGNAIIDAAHFAIGADTAAVYGLAAAGPASARATVLAFGMAGEVLGRAAGNAPHLAANLFLGAVAVPGSVAPALAQAAFSAEYAGAQTFLAGTHKAANAYLAVLQNAGSTLYAGSKDASIAANAAGRMLAAAPHAVEDAYLGALGKSAVALNSVGDKLRLVPGAAQVAAATQAVAPALTVGERAALYTYRTIHDALTSTSNAFALLFAPPPQIVLPTGPAPAKPATTTPVAVVPARTIAVSSYPTYTTVVKGVDKNYVDQSISLLNDALVARINDAIRPVANQVATNITTIQEVNMIQDLSNLIVRNGDFRGGTFDSGTLSNGVSVSAATGSFDSLTGGATTLGTTTVSGPLTIGSDATLGSSLTASGSVSASNFIASSTSATSTFAGPLAVGTTTPYGNNLLTVGTSSPSLIVTNNGLVGIGTTSPMAAFAVSGNTYLAGNLTVTGDSLTLGNSTTNTLTINSSITSDIVPNQNATYNLGSPSFYWKNAYVANLNANNISAASTTISGTSNDTFTLNSDNASADTEDASLIFFRGTVVPNALLTWNSTKNRFEFNQPLFIQNADTSSSTIVTLDLKGLAGQTADVLRVASSSGASYLEVTGAGKLGIGTSTPAVSFDLYATDAMRIPVGTTAERPGTGDIGFIRYNTTAHQFEGFGDSGVWQGLGGVINTAGTTYITASNTDTLDFVTAGVEHATLTSSGNFGVGTTTPWGLLSVNPNGISSPAFVVGSSTATDFVVTNSGNVGIGTTSPFTTLAVNGSAYVGGNIISGKESGATSDLALRGSSSSNTGIMLNSGILSVSLVSQGTERLRVRSAGVYADGLIPLTGNSIQLSSSGNASAYLGLEVDSTGNTGDTRIFAHSAVNTSGSIILNPSDRTDGKGNVGIGTTTPWARLAVMGTSTDATNAFLVADSGNTPRFLVQNSGNVGVGTTSPATTLSVSGSEYLTGGLGVGTLNTTAGSIAVTGTIKNSSSDLVLNAQGNVVLQSFGGTSFTVRNTGTNILAGGLSVTPTVSTGTFSPTVINDVATLTGTNSASVYLMRIVPAYSSFTNNGSVYGLYTDVSGMSGTGTAYSGVFLGGNLGIGTSSPQSRLAIQNDYGSPSGATATLFAVASSTASDGSTATNFFTVNGRGDATVSRTLTANTLVGSSLLVNGASTLQGTLNVTGATSLASNGLTVGTSQLVVSNGNVGIGTTSPTASLGIQGSIGVNTSQLYLAANGNVGVGTTSPYAKLAIHANNGETNTTLFAIASSTAAATTTLFSVDNTGLTTVGDASGSGNAIFQFAGDTNAWAVGYNSVDKSFDIASSTNFTSGVALTITKTLNVGIGTTTPGSALSVQGVANFGTATSTFYSSGGINLSGGCFAVNGVCVSGSGGGAPAAIYATSTPGSNVTLNFTGTPGSAPSFSGGILTLPSDTTKMIVELVGAGGGGAASGSTSSTNNGSAGGNSCFGTNSTACTSPTLSANGGAGGVASSVGATGGAGGSASGGDVNINGQAGAGGSNATAHSGNGSGGSSVLGLGGPSVIDTSSTGTTGNAGGSMGGGGSSGGTDGSAGGGGGGGGGGYVKKLYTSPSGTYYFTVGAGGAAGPAGSTGSGAGGAGAAGGIVITVYAASGNPTIGTGSTGDLPYYAAGGNVLTATSSVFLATSGNVGIGTTTPSASLDVFSNVNAGAANSGQLLLEGSANNIGLQLNNYQSGGRDWAILSAGGSAGGAPSSLRIYDMTSAADRLVIDSSGDIGIGTTTPWAQLSINPNGISGPALVVGSSTATNFIVTNGGNVGIGTANPSPTFDNTVSSRLVVSGAGANMGIASIRTTTPGGGGAFLTLATTRGTDANSYTALQSGDGIGTINFMGTDGTQFITSAAVQAIVTSAVSTNNVLSDLRFETSAGGANTLLERMRITSAGNVGIGTSSPNAALQVAADSAGGSTNSSLLQLKLTGSTDARKQLDLGFDTTNNIASIQSVQAGVVTMPLALNSGGGNVFISTTTSSIGAKLTLTFDGSGSQGILIHNSTNNSSGAAIRFEDSLFNHSIGGIFFADGGPIQYNTTSDIRLKENISTSTTGLATLLQIPIDDFSFISDPTHTMQQGYIAQELYPYYPEAVHVGGADPSIDPWEVDYGRMTPLLARAIQQLGSAVDVTNALTGTSTLLSYYAGTSTPAVYVDPSGNVGIGTTTPNHTLTVSGDVGAIGFVNTSTRDAKTDISYVDASTTEQMFSQLLELKVATYRYKIESPNDPLRLGFIAEDAEQIAPEVLSPDGKGVDLYKLATFTLSGVQTLAAKVSADETRLASLEERVTALENGSITIASGSPITLSTSSLASALQSFGVLIEKGVAQFNTLVFRQLVASKDADGTSSAGSVSILAGNTVAQVNNSLVKPSTKVFITFNAQVTGSWWVSDKTDGSFRVVLSVPQTGDVSFDYFLVQTEGQIATSTPDGSYIGIGAPSVTLSSGPDTVPPVITLLGDNPVHVSVGATFTDPGIQVTDNADGSDPYSVFVNGVAFTGSLSTLDTSSPTTYLITYSATDQAGNTSSAIRSVIVGNPDGTVSVSGTTTSTTTTSTATTTTATSTDTTAPVVTLLGSPVISLTTGGTWTDPGATATDDTDGDLTGKIVVSGTVDTSTAGLYTLTYSATDAAGNTGSASRVVSVTDATTTSSTGTSTTTATITTTTTTTDTTATSTATTTSTDTTATTTTATSTTP